VDQNDKAPLEGPVGIIAKPGATEARPLLRRVASWLRVRRIPFALDHEAARILAVRGGKNGQDLAHRSSLLIVIGGDGTLLSVAYAAARAQTPILGVNLGTLGFLTEVSRERLFIELNKLRKKKPRFDDRLMLEMRILRNGRTVRSGTALNEVVINKKSTIARAVDLSVEVDRRYVTSYKSDGLIVATPTGSTAYSLSAGGPILDPKLEVLILNPICPHTLTHRPLVLEDTVTIEVSLKTPLDGVAVTLDGRIGFPVKAGDRIRINRSPDRLRLLRTVKADYFHLLRSKLKWGERLGR
jgi:NAD+ kinase